MDADAAPPVVAEPSGGEPGAHAEDAAELGLFELEGIENLGETLLGGWLERINALSHSGPVCLSA